MKRLITLLVLSFSSAQVIDPDIRSGNQVTRIKAFNHRDVADTLSHSNTWNSAFIQNPGDAMIVAFQMPADGIIKGVNVPIALWSTGDPELTVGLYELAYPHGLDANEDPIRYPQTTVDGQGWIGGYDMIPESGAMFFDGYVYTPPGTAPECSIGVSSVADYAVDPLGEPVDSPGYTVLPLQGLIWPDGFIAPTLNPSNNPADDTEILDNWIATADYGTEPIVVQGTWIGILVFFSGAGTGDDSPAFWYADADSLGLNDPWVGLKFYGVCGGPSGSAGWHIRHWVFNFELAIEYTAVDVESEFSLPTAVQIHQNHPNPFNPTTTINYELPQRSDVQITIFDLLGREITTLVSETQDAGFKSVKWDATNTASGIYFYRLQTGGQAITRKLVVLK